jgi:regulator of RNase E activity RraA
MTNAGFKALARRMCVGHAHVHVICWGCEVEVFGRKIRSGQLIHADKHGFLAIPEGEETNLLDAARFMDTNECETVIPAARGSVGLPVDQIIANMAAAGKQFGENVRKKFRRQGEW